MQVDGYQIQTSKAEDRVWFKKLHSECAIILVIDGHGGDKSADTACRLISERILNDLATQPPELACETSIAAASSAVRSETSGCVLVLCILYPDRVVCANVGDARAWLFPEHAAPFEMSSSHAFQASLSERTRVARLANLAPASRDGKPAGVLRAWPGGLAMGRSLGDADCPYVLPTPTISSTPIVEPSRVVVASDGLWDAQAIEQVAEHLRKRKSAKKLVRRAWLKRSCDDITAVVASVGFAPQKRGFLGFWSDSSSSIASSDSSEEEMNSFGGDGFPPRHRLGVAL